MNEYISHQFYLFIYFIYFIHYIPFHPLAFFSFLFSFFLFFPPPIIYPFHPLAFFPFFFFSLPLTVPEPYWGFTLQLTKVFVCVFLSFQAKRSLLSRTPIKGGPLLGESSVYNLPQSSKHGSIPTSNTTSNSRQNINRRVDSDFYFS